MKIFKRGIALLLAAALLLPCFGSAFAAEPTRPAEPTEAVEATSTETTDTTTAGNAESAVRIAPETLARMQKADFAPDAKVTAIVLLDSPTEAEVADRNTPDAEAQRARLNAEHAAFLSALDGVADYELTGEFTALVNGFALELSASDLTKVAALDGVRTLYLANSYNVPETTTAKKTQNANEMTGNDKMVEASFAGQGQAIAILDTGILLDHEAFRVYDDNFGDTAKLSREDIANFKTGTYYSEKIPFGKDYADRDNDPSDDSADGSIGHGTHVAGIAAGYVEKDGAVTFSGAAPQAQLMIMKIFPKGGASTNSGIYLKALDDAYKLGADVINMSIGSPSGFTSDKAAEYDVFQNIYEELSNKGVVLAVAGGNDYSMAAFSSSGSIGADYTDYGTISSPGAYTGTVSVASMENSNYMAETIEVNGTTMEFVVPSYDASATGVKLWHDAFAGQELEFIVPLDREGNLITARTWYDFADPSTWYTSEWDQSWKTRCVNKIVVVKRGGETTFDQKLKYAQEVGAKGVIVVGTDDERIGMVLTEYRIPAIYVQAKYESVFTDIVKEAESGEIKIKTPDEMYREIPNALEGTLSTFSNWGTSPDLTIDPAISGVGGNIFSAYYRGNDDYAVLSGTSMASPNIAGTFANLLSYLDTKLSDKSGETYRADRAALAKALMESSANIVLEDQDGGTPYSVRKQGSGLANALLAKNLYENGAYLKQPLQELGDDASQSGEYQMELTLCNATDSPVTYDSIKAYITTDKIEDGKNTLTATDLFNSKSTENPYAVLDCQDSVTVQPTSEAKVTVTVRLTEEGKTYLKNTFPNGAFVEGYIVFSNEQTKQSCHATMLAYFGDWTKASAFEKLDWGDFFKKVSELWLEDHTKDTEWYMNEAYNRLGIYTSPNEAMLVDYDRYLFAQNFGGSYNSYYLGVNPYSELLPYDKARNAVSTRSQYADSLMASPFLLRNVRELNMTVTDAATGSVLSEKTSEYVPKSYYTGDYWTTMANLAWMPEKVTDGTRLRVDVSATLPYQQDEEPVSTWSFEATVDSEAPVIESAEYAERNGRKYVDITARDNEYLAAVIICYKSPSTGALVGYDGLAFAEEKGKSVQCSIDVTTFAEAYDEVYIQAVDYALNETAEFTRVSLFETGVPCTVTLSLPDKTITQQTQSGERFSFPPVLGDYGDYSFICWSSQEIESATNLNGVKDATYYDAGDSYRANGDATFYAVFAKSEYTAYDKTHYDVIAPGTSNFSGDFAITDWCYALNSKGETIHLGDNLNNTPDEIADIEFRPSEIQEHSMYNFSTNSTEIRYTFTPIAGTENQYSIRNQKSGKYLALRSDPTQGTGLEMVDSVTDRAKWSVTTNGDNNIYIRSAVDNKMILLYDQFGTNRIQIFNDEVYTKPFEWASPQAPSSLMQLFLCRATDGQINPTGSYTTRLTVKVTFMLEGQEFATKTFPFATRLTDADYPTLPEREGMVGTWEKYTDPIRQDIVIEGSYVPVSEATCEVTFVADGKTVGTLAVPYGHVLTEAEYPAVPEKPGYTGAWEKYDEPVTSDITIEAVYTPVGTPVAKHTVTFVAETQTVKTMEVEDGYVLKDSDYPAVPEKSGYTGAWEKYDQPVKSDITIQAQYTRIPDEPRECFYDDYTDCTQAWYHEAVDFTVSEGLMYGVADKTFAPNDSLTRGQLVTILYRADGEPAVSGSTTFVDVEPNRFYTTPVLWAEQNGIVNGVGENRFDPNANITREQLVTILYRYAQKHGRDVSASAELKFPDAGEVGNFAKSAVGWAVAEGLINGKTVPGSSAVILQPKGSATRAEFATILMRYLGGAYLCENRAK